VRHAVLLLLFLPLGCGNADATRASMRVVATVNGVEISAAEAPTAQALERVIDRELLVQKALEAGLERDARVAARVEAARRRVLAQAWLERLQDDARPARDEVREFYARNPALFAERRIYRLRELVVAAPPALVEALRAEAARTGSLEELADWLRRRNVGAELARSVRPAEELPLAALPRLSRMRPGEIAVFEAPEGATVSELVHAEEAPLTEAQAAPLIEKFLSGRRRLELAAAEVRKLRQSASIQYVGDIQARSR
jgi:EpsD family peptidyl-prolyl cis-trans isomerase